MKSLVFVAPGRWRPRADHLPRRRPRTASTSPGLAAVTGERDVRRATAREANELTGFSIGGIPPIGHIRPDSRRHGPGPRAFRDGLGRGRDARRRLPRSAGNASHPRQCVVAPIAEEQRVADVEARSLDSRAGVGGFVRRRPGPSTERRGADLARYGRPTARRDDRLSRRAAGPLALGRQRSGRRGLRPVGGGRHARRSRPAGLRGLRGSCAGRSCGSTGPAAPWTARFASTIHDEPAAFVWDDHGLFVVKYGFHTYAFDARSGELRWSHRSATPLLAVFGSPRLAHVVVPVRDRDLRDRAGRDGRVADRPQRRRDRGRARRRAARPDELRWPSRPSIRPRGARRADTARGGARVGNAVDNRREGPETRGQARLTRSRRGR